MINMLRKGIKFSIQRVYFPQSYFESRHYGKRFNSIRKFKSLTFQLRAIYFHTFAVDLSVHTHIICSLFMNMFVHITYILFFNCNPLSCFTYFIDDLLIFLHFFEVGCVVIMF